MKNRYSPGCCCDEPTCDQVSYSDVFDTLNANWVLPANTSIDPVGFLEFDYGSDRQAIRCLDEQIDPAFPLTSQANVIEYRMVGDITTNLTALQVSLGLRPAATIVTPRCDLIFTVTLANGPSGLGWYKVLFLDDSNGPTTHIVPAMLANPSDPIPVGPHTFDMRVKMTKQVPFIGVGTRDAEIYWFGSLLATDFVVGYNGSPTNEHGIEVLSGTLAKIDSWSWSTS